MYFIDETDCKLYVSTVMAVSMSSALPKWKPSSYVR